MSRVHLALSTALVALLVGLRLAWTDGLLGAPGGELFGHAWVQWWHADALPRWPDGPGALLLHPRPWPVIDPLPTLFAAILTRLSGAVVGWNALVLGCVMLAFAGGASLARRVDGDPVIGGLALALAPSLMGSAASGLTEDLSIGLAALCLARLGDKDTRRSAQAGLFLGLLAWCGPLVAWATGLAALGLGIALLIRDRSRWKGLVASAVLTVVIALPAAMLQGSRLAGGGHRSGEVLARTEPLWRLNPWQGVDLASLLLPGPMDPGDALVRMHPGYLGVSLLGLALLGGWSRWWPVLAVAVLLAPGPHLSWMGEPLGVGNPAATLLDFVPMGDLVNHHGRLLLVGAVALAALASRGAAKVPRKWRLFVGGLVAMDLAALSPVPAILPVTSIAPLGVYDCDSGPCVANLPPGGLLDLPVAGPGVHFQRPLLQQMHHHRPIMADPNRPGLPPNAVQTESGRWLASLAFPDPAPAPTIFEAPSGVAVIVVRAPFVSACAAVLGPPDIERAGSAAWDVGRSTPE
jgi:hypothetical protein